MAALIYIVKIMREVPLPFDGTVQRPRPRRRSRRDGNSRPLPMAKRNCPNRKTESPLSRGSLSRAYRCLRSSGRSSWFALNQNYLERTPNSSRETKCLTVYTVAAIFGPNYDRFALYQINCLGETLVNTISTPRALVAVYFRYCDSHCVHPKKSLALANKLF